MSQSSNSQIKEFVDFIREGNFEGVKKILLEKSDNANPLLKKKFGQFKVSEFPRLRIYVIIINRRLIIKLVETFKSPFCIVGLVQYQPVCSC